MPTLVAQTAHLLVFFLFNTFTVVTNASDLNEVTHMENSWETAVSSDSWGRGSDGTWHVWTAGASLLALSTVNFVDASAHFAIEWTYSVQFAWSSEWQSLALGIYNGIERTRCQGYLIEIANPYPSSWDTYLIISKVNEGHLAQQLSVAFAVQNQVPQTLTIHVRNGNQIEIIDTLGNQQLIYTDSDPYAVLDGGQNLGYIGFYAEQVAATVSSLFVSGEKINAVAMNVFNCDAVTTMEPAILHPSTPQLTNRPSPAPTLAPSTTQPTTSTQYLSSAPETTVYVQTQPSQNVLLTTIASAGQPTSTTGHSSGSTLAFNSETSASSTDLQDLFSQHLGLSIAILTGCGFIFWALLICCCVVLYRRVCKRRKQSNHVVEHPSIAMSPLAVPSAMTSPSMNSQQGQMFPVAAGPSDYDELLQHGAAVNVVTVGGDEQYDIRPQDSDEVQQWLQNMVQLPVYYRLFIEHGFESLELVCAITRDSELKDIGIDSIHDRRIILAAIGALDAREDSDTFKTMNSSAAKFMHHEEKSDSHEDSATVARKSQCESDLTEIEGGRDKYNEHMLPMRDGDTQMPMDDGDMMRMHRISPSFQTLPMARRLTSKHTLSFIGKSTPQQSTLLLNTNTSGTHDEDDMYAPADAQLEDSQTSEFETLDATIEFEDTPVILPNEDSAVVVHKMMAGVAGTWSREVRELVNQDEDDATGSFYD